MLLLEKYINLVTFRCSWIFAVTVGKGKNILPWRESEMGNKFGAEQGAEKHPPHIPRLV
jgi:hypothetical protein